MISARPSAPRRVPFNPYGNFTLLCTLQEGIALYRNAGPGRESMITICEMRVGTPAALAAFGGERVSFLCRNTAWHGCAGFPFVSRM